MALDKTIKLRLPSEELDQWKREAESQAMTLSAWVRWKCGSVFVENVKPIEFEIPIEAESLHEAATMVKMKMLAERPPVMMDELREKFPKKISKTCPHGTEKGYRCWNCGGLAKIGE